MKSKNIFSFDKQGENIWSNFKFDSDKAYALFYGNHDFSELTDALVPILNNKYQKPVEIIKIANRVGNLEENIIATHSKIDELMENKETNKWLWSPSVEQLNSFFESEYFRGLTDKIIENQGDLIMDVFQNNFSSSLDDRIKVLGPPKEIVEKLVNKFNMYDFLENKGFLMPEGYRIQGRKGVLEAFDSNFKEGIFVSKNKSGAGSGCRIFNNRKEIMDSDFLGNDEKYFVKKKVDIASSPTISGCISKNGGVSVFYLTDQSLEGTEITGVEYPSKLSPNIQRQIKEMTRDIGKVLSGEGYYSFYNVDFMVTPNDEIYVAEINPRKFGSIVEYSEANEAFKKNGELSLAEIGYYSVMDSNVFLRDVQERNNLYWARNVLKAPSGTIIKNNLEGYAISAKQAFSQNANGFYHNMGQGTEICSVGKGCLGDLLLVSNNSFDVQKQVQYHSDKIRNSLGVQE